MTSTTDKSNKQHVSVVIAGHVDSGKSFCIDTPILMFDGSTKLVQNIKIGDKVMGDDSKGRLVTNTTTGTDDMYDIIPIRGNKYTVTSCHDLVLKATNYELVNYDQSRDRYRVRWLEDFKIKEKIFTVSKYLSKDDAFKAAETFLHDEVPTFVGYTKPASIVEIKASEFYELPERVQAAYEGFTVPLDFEENKVDIDPYALGYWLGDGDSAGTRITTAEEEVVEYFEKFAKDLNLELKHESNYRYAITTSTNFDGPDRNPFRNFLKNNNLIDNKHIPDNYKMNSKENRLKLLAGLIDSDGHNNNNTYDFCLKSEKLADDIIFLARSLGFFTYKTKTQKTCTNGATGPVVGNYYRFCICGEGLEQIPVLLERKKAHERESIKNACVNGIKIEKIGEQTYYGFETDGNHRFLLGDFTVVHNSTTTGRLIYELGGMTSREMDKLTAEAKLLKDESFKYAYYTDTTKAERERGITIQCTTKQFFTDNYWYTIIDAPGHRDFMKNMITGASQADVGVLMVPADSNFTSAIAKEDHDTNQVQGQTRQHGLMFNLLGIKQLIVCVNKMDCDVAKYSKERFEEVKDEMIDMLVKVGWPKGLIEKGVVFLPLSGFKGDNLLKKSENMPWWTGQDVQLPKSAGGGTVHVETLFDALDKFVRMPPRKTDAPFRMPVSGVYNIKGIGDVITGRVEQGVIKPGNEVMFLPSHTASNDCTGKVFSIEIHHTSKDSALPGDNVGLNVKGLAKDRLPSVGDVMILKTDNTLKAVKEFTAQVQVLNHPGELKVGYSPIGFVRTGKSAIKITKINWRNGKETGHQKVDNPEHLKAGDAAEVIFEPTSGHGFVVESFDKCEGLARLAVMEGNSAVMLGKIIDVQFKN